MDAPKAGSCLFIRIVEINTFLSRILIRLSPILESQEPRATRNRLLPKEMRPKASILGIRTFLSTKRPIIGFRRLRPSDTLHIIAA